MNPTDGGKSLDLSLAHLLVRVGLGIHLVMHALPRLIEPLAYAPLGRLLAAGDVAAGILLILGLWMRSALVLGMVLLYPLLYGAEMIPMAWAYPLVCLLLFAALLATAHCDRFSLDAWRRRHRAARAADGCR